jgi:hypothetical protein
LASHLCRVEGKTAKRRMQRLASAIWNGCY